MDQLLLWNKTKYTAQLISAFGSDNVVTNNNDLSAIIPQLDKFSSVIVLCELDWLNDGKDTNRQHLHGIEIVKELRRKYDLKIPTLFVSFHSLADIFTAEREILTAIGHGFYQLPATPQDFKGCIKDKFGDNGKIQTLSIMELNDIKSFYCNKEGILSHELHSLNHFLNYSITKENRDRIFAELQKIICKIYDLFLMSPADELIDFQIRFRTLNKENINEAVNYISRLGNDLVKTQSGKTVGIISDQKVKEKYKWKVLLLDDQINEQHGLVQLMNNNNINVICVGNSPEAKRILHKDWETENSIMVVIADYRLYENIEGIKHHQKIQGYQFLKEITTSDHLIRLVAFSGLPRNFLMSSFEHYNIRTVVKSKTYYLSSNQNQQFFCDEIIELAKENLKAIEAMPSNSAAFKNSLEVAYKMFRMHPDYNKMESIISLTSKEYAWTIQQQIADGKEIRIGAIDNIKSPLSQPKKDLETFFKRFQNYLVARRIALWLLVYSKKFGKEIDNNIIAKILIDEKEYTPSACRAVVNTNLGLSLADFPKNITIEERRWLQFEMQVNIFRDIQYIDSSLLKIAIFFQKCISDESELKKSIVKDNLTIIIEYKKKKKEKVIQEKYQILFDEKLFPKLTSSTDVRMLYQFIKKTLHNSKEKEKSNKMLKSLTSKIRFTLFENRDKSIYLKNTFLYFNEIYRLQNKEQSYLYYSDEKLKDKSNFTNKSKTAINMVYETTYGLLLNNQFPKENELSDVFSIFVTGESLIVKFGRKLLGDKAKFFNELTKAINSESKLIGSSYDDTFQKRKYNGDEDSDDDFIDFPMEEDLD